MNANTSATASPPELSKSALGEPDIHALRKSKMSAVLNPPEWLKSERHVPASQVVMTAPSTH